MFTETINETRISCNSVKRILVFLPALQELLIPNTTANHTVTN